MELHRGAQRHARSGAGDRILLVGKQNVQRRQPLIAHVLQQRLNQGRTGLRVHRQQARAGHGREGHGHQGLGVVVQAVLGISAGPSPVEHVLAVGVVLEVERAGRHQLGALPQRHELRLPASLSAGTGAAVQGSQVGVAHERAARGALGEQRVPSLGIDGQR